MIKIPCSNCSQLHLKPWLTHPILQFLDLLLAPLHCNLLSLIQAVLQVLDGLLHVLLHALQVRAGVLLLLQLLCHHGRISNGLLGLFLSIPALLQSLLHLRLKLGRIGLQLLLLVYQAGVLKIQKR